MDLETLVFANFLLMVFATLALAILARIYPQVAGMRAFILATTALAAGAALVEVADPVHSGAALALANGLLLVGLACLNWAIAVYWHRPWPHLRWHLGAAAAMSALYLVFTGAHNQLGARAVIVGTAMGFELACGARLFRGAQFRQAAWAMAAFAAFNFLRGPATWYALPQPGLLRWVLVVTNYGFLLFSAVMALVLVWMVILDLRSRLERLALTDELTGLANRRGLERQAAVTPGAMVVLDLDRFKDLNDRWGHATGDAALQVVADFLRRHLRTDDLAARLGGEEFVVLLPQLDLELATRLAERLCRELATLPLRLAHPDSRLTASWGVAARLPGESWGGWLQRADAALYAAKQAGRNCVRQARADHAMVRSTAAP